MGKKSEQVQMRIVSHADNLDERERRLVEQAAEQIGVGLGEINGITLIDDCRVIVLLLRNGELKVVDPNR